MVVCVAIALILRIRRHLKSEKPPTGEELDLTGRDRTGG